MPLAAAQTPQAVKILAVLRERNDWMTRGELANAIGKEKLGAYDITQLEFLEAKRRIESRHTRAFRKPTLWEYKAKP